MFRIAIVDADRCQPRKCAQECKRMCPVVAQGKKCIDATPHSIVAIISEELCNGCNICTKVCPFDAIQIINLPTELGKDKTHQYGKNSFSLYRLPAPRFGQVLGLLGRNGTGKTTSLKILSGELPPNFGDFGINRYDVAVRHFRGSSLQDYFRAITTGKLSVSMKPQKLETFAIRLGIGTVREKLELLGLTDHISHYALETLLDKDIEVLSGGELQRLAIAATCVKTASSYLFDEPSSFLDIRQRLRACGWITECSRENTYVSVIEHDLAVLDYISDNISFYYGKQAGYGVITTPMNVRDGINTYLEGYLPKENVRFRDEVIDFGERALETSEAHESTISMPSTEVVLGADTLAPFKLTIDKTDLCSGEIVVLLGENGCGKTTWLRTLAKYIRDKSAIPAAVKTQHVTFVNPTESVEKRMTDIMGSRFSDTIWRQTVLQPLGLERLLNMPLNILSGGEAQTVAIAITLGKSADAYLIDEPSANLDTEQRIAVGRVLRKFATQYNKLITVIDHDFLLASYIADKVVIFSGEPGVNTKASAPRIVAEGMNEFLAYLGVTFRRDGSTGRPRINKAGSQKDREQRAAGQYWTTTIAKEEKI